MPKVLLAILALFLVVCINQPPTVRADFEVASYGWPGGVPPSSCPVAFVPAGSYGADVYYWDFGDGNKDTVYGDGKTARIYASAGEYFVTLRAYNGGIGEDAYSSKVIKCDTNSVSIIIDPKASALSQGNLK
jgi:PKD repeat protein